MARPKFEIGDIFNIERKVTQDGDTFTGTFPYVVLAVTVESTSDGYAYKYGLGRQFPGAYFSVPITIWNYEPVVSNYKKLGNEFKKEVVQTPVDTRSWLGTKSLEGYNG